MTSFAVNRAVADRDRALGFWAAVREVWPQTQGETGWVHRIANALDKLQRLHGGAKRALQELMYADSWQACARASARFVKEYEAKSPKAVESLTRDQDQLLAHFAFPAERWKHLRTTNPIQSAFATVKLRQWVAKGVGSRTAGLTIPFRLLTMAQQRWRRLDAGHLVAEVRARVRFDAGARVEREDTKEETKVAA